MPAEEEALEGLRSILANPEFQYDPSTPWWQQLLTFVLDPIGAFFAWLVRTAWNAATGNEGLLGIVLVLLSALVLAACVAYLLRSVFLSVRGDSRVRGGLAAERRARSDQLWHEAQTRAAAGEWTEAVRAAYLSALYALDEHAVLHVQSGQTNVEHAMRLSRDHPELGDAFAELVRRYDRLRYGHFPVTAEVFSEVSALVQRARAA
jgi:hypothetical protein